jgi:energy-coupling factor transporter ATP-binding protein EcfA2
MTAITYLEVAQKLSELFDYSLPKEIKPFDAYDLSHLSETDFRLGVVVGSSGSGKTQAIKTINQPYENHKWSEDKCIADHFSDVNTAMSCLHGAGLNSIPQWMKPYHLLSNGEQYRADSARILSQIEIGGRCTIIDEFTSVVDRTVARSLCESLNKFLEDNSRVVVATCHIDVLDWLNADWILNTNERTMSKGQKYEPHWVNYVYEQVGVIRRA